MTRNDHRVNKWLVTVILIVSLIMAYNLFGEVLLLIALRAGQDGSMDGNLMFPSAVVSVIFYIIAIALGVFTAFKGSAIGAKLFVASLIVGKVTILIMSNHLLHGK